MQNTGLDISRTVAALPAEARILLCCARTTLEPGRLAELESLLAELDAAGWERLDTLGSRHGVLPLVYVHVKSLPPDSIGRLVPADALERLRSHYHGNAMRSMALGSELVKLLHALRSNGVDALPVKGITLASQAYGDPQLRQPGDLDLLIPPGAYRQASSLLERLGYQARSPAKMSPWQELAWSRFQVERHFNRPELLVDLDLHWRLFDRRILPFEFDELWQRREQVRVHGGPVNALAAEDHLIYLCAHGSKHGWETLKWLVDVAELLRARPALDWPQVQARAIALNAQRMLWLGLALARRLLDAPLPAVVVRAITADPAVEPPIDQAYARLLSRLQPVEVTLAQASKLAPLDRQALDERYRMATLWTNLRLLRHQEHGDWRQAALSVRSVLTPGAREIQWVALPPVLHSLYYAVRLARVASRLAVDLVQTAAQSRCYANQP